VIHDFAPQHRFRRRSVVSHSVAGRLTGILRQLGRGGNGSGGDNGGGGSGQKGGSTGSGGTSATGGVTGSGGTVSTGGTTGTGGATSTGGVTGSGGKAGGTGSGGSTGTGGAAGSGSGSCPATTTLKAGDNNETITSSGDSRTFIVHVPTGYTGKSAVPVILDFHPLGGSGSQQEGSSGWKGQCDSVGCIAVFPDSSKAKASDNSWNAGYCCDNAEKNQVDDVQFARDMIKWLETNACVDPKRIYASGGSNGGGMTYRLACEAADVIAAVAPVDFRCVTGKDPLASAGSVTAANNTACVCTLPRPITVVAYDEGQDNSIVPYNGAQTPRLATDCAPNSSCVGIGFPSAVVNRDTWAKFDGCAGSATTYSGNSICQQYATCTDNTTVMLCTNPSSNHLAAYSSSTAKVAATAWGVFQNQTLP
jgi:polyhydroxybutyrate depolymerase